MTALSIRMSMSNRAEKIKEKPLRNHFCSGILLVGYSLHCVLRQYTDYGFFTALLASSQINMIDATINYEVDIRENATTILASDPTIAR